MLLVRKAQKRKTTTMGTFSAEFSSHFLLEDGSGGLFGFASVIPSVDAVNLSRFGFGAVLGANCL